MCLGHSISCAGKLFQLPKGHKSGRSRHFLSFPKAVWSDFLPKKGLKPEVKGTFPDDKRGVP
ncbi:MAG: hypothetical protein ACK5HZ_12055 [Macellibacteroides fermentans]